MNHTTKQHISQSEIAHLVKTPLSIIRAQTRLAHIAPATDASIVELTSSIEEQVIRLNLSLDCLQILDNSNEGRLPTGNDVIDLHEITQKIAKTYHQVYLTSTIKAKLINVDKKHLEILIESMVALLVNEDVQTVKLIFSPNTLQVSANLKNSSIVQNLAEVDDGSIGRYPILLITTIKTLSNLYGFNLDFQSSKITFSYHE